MSPHVLLYCRFGNFLENFVFANSVTRHISGVLILQLWHDLRLSVNYRVISPFCGDFTFRKLRSFMKIKPSQKFPNRQYLLVEEKRSNVRLA